MRDPVPGFIFWLILILQVITIFLILGNVSFD